jgi:TetR/AcrR family tetracycline transcriptional repressor
MPRAASSPSRRRSGLEQDQLVAAALELLQAQGVDGISTRQLAERLGVKSPALYWHVRNKDELLGLVADAICANMALPSSALSFRARLENIAWEYRRVLIGYRDATRLFAELPPTGPHRIALYEAAVGAFRDNGFALPEAIAMATFYRNYLLGMISEECRQSQPARARPTVALGIELAHLGEAAGSYPNLRDAAGLLAQIESEELFRLGLKVLLDGMACRVDELRRLVAAEGHLE